MAKAVPGTTATPPAKSRWEIEVAARRDQRAAGGVGDADQEPGVAAQAAHLRPEEQADTGDAQHRAEEDRGRRRRPEEDPGAEQVPEDHEGEEHGHQAGGQRGLGPVDQHVVEPEEQHPERRQPEVIAQAEAERDPPQPAPAEQQRRREREAPGDRDLGRDQAELELDDQPGGAPDEGGDGEEQQAAGADPAGRGALGGGHERGTLTPATLPCIALAREAEAEGDAPRCAPG